MPPQSTCSIPDCANRRKARGWCNQHYLLWWRYGDTVGRRQPTAVRFWSKVDRRGRDDCWLWTGSKNHRGYGVFQVSSKNVRAHRWAYEHEVSPIPDGLTIDHLCRTRLCQNVRHMEPVTHKVNVLRGTGPTALNARKTHCLNSHEFTPENTYVNPKGERSCRQCRLARQRTGAR